MTPEELAEFAPDEAKSLATNILDWADSKDPYRDEDHVESAAYIDARNAAHVAGPTLRMYWKLQEAEKAYQQILVDSGLYAVLSKGSAEVLYLTEKGIKTLVGRL